MKILVLPGDGIGPEITDATMTVLNAVDAQFALGLDMRHGVGAVQVQVVTRRSPAALGYVLKDDVVTHLNGAPVSDSAQLVSQLTALRGETVEFTVLRDGDAQVKEVSLNP